MMKQISRFEPNHDDLVHSLSYDFYGTKLASCSTDQKIKVYSFNSTKLSWVLSESWKAHEATILKVCWAHPEFGTIIASCSADRTVRIFEETLVEHNYNNLSGTTNNKRWVERAKLIESRGPVMDIQFAPSHLGLKLATVSCDGYVRIYEAMDVINLNNWSCMEEIPIENIPTNKEGFQEGLCLAWCHSKFCSPQIAVGCGPDNCVKLLRSDQSTNGKFQFKEKLFDHEGPVHSVSWAPNFGRSFELIATGSKDTKVRLFKLFDPTYYASNSESTLNYEIDIIASFSEHSMEVWKVEFNILGTILASSGDDGKVLLYKASHGVDWKCMSIISSDTNQQPPNPMSSINHNNGFDITQE
ncbi:WD40 repeat-like protein [Neoconidiobolus thromboides FSU 785]|nr:WD40 repeat-like protein [Neoconidiobolus thromboides FSU 785]